MATSSSNPVTSSSTVLSSYPVLCSEHLDASRDYYCALLGLVPIFECGWYTALGHPDDPTRQVIAFVVPDHHSVPAPNGSVARGMLATFDVEDVDVVHNNAAEAGLDIVLTLRDEEFGQRHFMVRDPNGVLVDVVQTIPPSRNFLREVASWRRANR